MMFNDPMSAPPLCMDPDDDADYYRGGYASEMLQAYSDFNGGGYIDTRAWDRRTVEERIDEIPRDIVARADLTQLMAAPECPWIVDTLRFLQPEVAGAKIQYHTAAEAEDILTRKGRPARDTLSQTMSHVIDKLQQESTLYQLLDSVNPKSAVRCRKLENTLHRSFASAFLVEKAGKTRLVRIFDTRGKAVGKEEMTLLRVITDARNGNAECADDASFPLFTLEALLQTISNVSRHAQATSKRWYAVNVDLRHWFHQLPLPPDLQHLFMLRSAFAREGLPPELSSIYFVPRALPMGWRLAPRIAQAATWSLLVGGEYPLPGGMPKPSSQPAWLPFENGLGGVFALIDNILIVTPYQGVAESWARRLTARGRECNVEFKDISFTDGKRGREQVIKPVVIGPQTVGSPSGGFTFCGIQFDHTGWGITPRERKLDPTRADPPLSYRDVAALLGEILWDLRVRRIPTRTHPGLMDVYTAVAPRTVQAWDEPAPLSDAQRAQLVAHAAEARRYLRRDMLPEWHPGRTESYAVDACAPDRRGFDPHARRQLAWVRLTDDDVQPVPWAKASHSDEYIGEAELRAIVHAVRDARSRATQYADPLTLVHVATDSRVAQGWVERDYSSRPVAQSLLAQLAELLGGARIACYYVSTKDNVADEPSRTGLPDGDARAIFADRLSKTRALLRTEADRAIQQAVVDCHAAVRRGGGVRRERDEALLGEGS